MASKGWKPAPAVVWSDTLKLLSSSLPLKALPVLPQVHDGRHEDLTLVKHLPDDGRLVLRLWRSSTVLTPKDEALWLGNVSSQQQTHILNLLTFAETASDFHQPFEILLQDAATLPYKKIEGLLLLREQN